MIKFFNNKRIIWFLGLSLSLLFLMLVGVLQVKAGIGVPCAGDHPTKTGECQTSCSTGNYPLAVADPGTLDLICDDTGAFVNWKCCAQAQCTVGTTTGFCRVPDLCPSGESALTGSDLLAGLIACTEGAEPGTPTYNSCCIKTGKTPCSGTIGTIAEPSGLCQSTCEAAKTITEPTLTAQCVAPAICCKFDTANPISKDCAEAGGACAAVTACPNTQQEVGINLLVTPCATGEKCCKASVENNTPGSQNPGGPQDEANAFAKAIGWLISILIWLFGALLLAVVELIVRVSQFNKIINSYFVVQGWIVLRDLVNMFFVLGLLFIAFVTVLKIERYQWQKLLPKLLIMAVVVNFSRTICGLMIDFFQVMMFTFVNAYKDIAGENIYKGLGLRDMWDFNNSTPTAGAEMGNNAFVLGRLLGLVYVVVALIVCLIFLVILVFRIVVLWILVVFSPLAFFSAAFTGISAKIGGYWSQWFKMFIEYCMVGPLLAFFLWLSILSIGSDYTTDYAQDMSPSDTQTQGQGSLNKAVITGNNAGRLDYIMKFVLGILMLVAGLKFTSEMKVMGSNLAGKAATKLQDATVGRAERLATWGANLPGAAVGLGGKYAGMTVKEGLGRVERERGDKFSGKLARWARLGGTKEGHKMLGERMEARIKGHVGGQKGALVEQRQKEIDRYQKQFELMGAGKNPEILKKQLESATGDRRIALMNIKGDQGKMDKETFDKALAEGDFEHYGVKTNKDGSINFEKSDAGGLANLEALGKKWEEGYEKKNNLPISITPFVRNPVTNDWERVAPGEAGEKRKLKDVEDTISKGGRDAAQKGISSGDFAALKKAEDIKTMGAHLSGMGKNSYLKNAGVAAQEKYEKQADMFLAIIKGDDTKLKSIAEEQAKDKGKTGDVNFVNEQMEIFKNAKKLYDKKDQDGKPVNQLSAEQLKNIQTGYVVSTGDWEPGSGRMITAGRTNTDLAEAIKEQQKKLRPEHENLNPALAKSVDELIPGALKSTDMLPMDSRVSEIKKQLNAVIPNQTFSDDLIKEYINNSSDITKQQGVKKDFGGLMTNSLSKLSNKVANGASQRDIAIAAGELEGLIAGMNHSVDSAGMSSEYFKFDKLKDLLNNIKGMSGKNVKAQQDAMKDILTQAKADDYYDYKIPDYKLKKGAQGAPATAQSSGGGAPSGGGGGAAPAPAPAPAPSVSTTINIVNNTAQSITSTAQQILSAANDPIALQQALTQTLRPLLDRHMADLQKSLGNSFDASVRDSVNKKVDALIAASGGSDIAASRKKIEAELPKIIDEIKKIEKTKSS